MKQGQKLLKYVVIAFAICLSFSIIMGIASAIIAIGAGTHIYNIASGYNEGKLISHNEQYENINKVSISMTAGELELVKGSDLKVDAKNVLDSSSFKVIDGVLTVDVKAANISNDAKVTVYIPEKLKQLTVTLNAGETTMTDINVDNLNLNAGAGTVDINGLTVINSAKIDSGIGETCISNADITNLVLESGIGSVEFDGYMKGRSSVKCGMGEIDLKLEGTKDIYQIEVSKGIGEININGKEVWDNYKEGTGSNIIEVSGGIGEVNIDY